MKRLAALLMVWAMVLACQPACLGESLADFSLEELLEQKALLEQAIAQAEENELIRRAIDALQEHWQKQIYTAEKNYTGDGYLEILWTRVVYIREDTTADMFRDMDCYVEFVLLSDYFGSSAYGGVPYYSRAGVSECVAFYRDGTCKVMTMDPLYIHRGRTYSVDYSGIIESISPRGTEFNRALYLTQQ